MRLLLQNYKACAVILKLLPLLLVINESQQGSGSLGRKNVEHATNSSDSISSYEESYSSESSSRSESEEYDSTDASTDIPPISPSIPPTACGYASLASHTLTEEASMLKYAREIDLEIADPQNEFSDEPNLSEFADVSTIFFPRYANTKPTDQPEMHAYRLANQGKHRKRDNIVTYSIRRYSSKMRKEDVDDVIRRAFEAWSDVSPLSFKKVDGKADITIQFSKDLSISVNGFAYYPKWGGKVTFNDNVNWTVDSAGGMNLRQTGTHEIGHALGLDHSECPSAVMYHTYPRYCPPDFTLHEDDVAAIQALYGKPAKSDRSPTPPPQRKSKTPGDSPRDRNRPRDGNPSGDHTPSRDPKPSRDQNPLPRDRNLPRDNNTPRDRNPPRNHNLPRDNNPPRDRNPSRDYNPSRDRNPPRDHKPSRNYEPLRDNNTTDRRSWRSTPIGNVYWPPIKRRGQDVLWVWDGRETKIYYYDRSSRGWFPYTKNDW